MKHLTVNGTPLSTQSQTVEELVIEIDAPRKGVAVAVNGEIVPRSEWAVSEVHENDVIDVVTAAAGG
jgi:sulfur carrier protein